MTLCTLSDVKAAANVATADTSRDAQLTLFMRLVTASIAAYLGYPIVRTTYTSEVYAINSNQYLYTRAMPIQSVSACTLAGVAFSAGTGDGDYQMTSEDAAAGRLYRAAGWQGRYFTRDMTYEPVAGGRDILLTYIAGWYTPDDAINYSAGAANSLPDGIVDACIQGVMERFRQAMNEAEGAQMVSEGGVKIAYNKTAPAGNTNIPGGLSEVVIGKLNPYKRWAIA